MGALHNPGRPGYMADAEPPSYHEPDENGFVGVSDEYRNYAVDTDKPLDAPGDDPQDLADKGVNNQFEYADAEASNEDSSDDDKNNVDDSPKKATSPSTTKGQAKASGSAS